MDINKASEILINAIKLAQKRGAYELEEVDVILQALKTVFPNKEEVKEKIEEEVKEETNDNVAVAD